MCVLPKKGRWPKARGVQTRPGAKKCTMFSPKRGDGQRPEGFD